MRIILASTSPRRQALLELLGVPFEVRNPTCDEKIVPGLTAQDSACYFAQAKAHSVCVTDPDAIVLGSDTLIELDGSALGKPADLEEARCMLHRLAGRRHQVHTAVTLSWLSRLIDTTQLSTAQIAMKPYNAVAHEQYLAMGDCLGKAGAYSIQGPGRQLIERLDGDFPTVVGLPLRLVAKLLTQVGVEIPVDIDQVYKTKPYDNWASFA